jgi:two-component system response regulator
MSDKIMLLVEDNPKDEALTLRALKKNNIRNEVVVARDGAAALDYLHARSSTSRRPPVATPKAARRASKSEAAMNKSKSR